MEKIGTWVRHYVSPAFVVLLFASFVLWYLSKLSYTYVTEQRVHLIVEGQPMEVTCVLEGIGTNLFAHMTHSDRTLRIPLEELHYEVVAGDDAESLGRVRIDPQSLQQSIAVRFTDIKVLSVGAVPDIELQQEL